MRTPGRREKKKEEEEEEEEEAAPTPTLERRQLGLRQRRAQRGRWRQERRTGGRQGSKGRRRAAGVRAKSFIPCRRNKQIHSQKKSIRTTRSKSKDGHAALLPAPPLGEGTIGSRGRNSARENNEWFAAHCARFPRKSTARSLLIGPRWVLSAFPFLSPVRPGRSPRPFRGYRGCSPTLAKGGGGLAIARSSSGR